MKAINVAAIQMDIMPLLVEKNKAKAQNMMHAVIEEKGHVDLFVLPEDFLTGPIPYHTASHTLNNDSQEIESFREFAKQQKCHIVLGSFIKNIGGKLFNTTLVINDHGDIVLEHHKTKLNYAERKYLTPGKVLKVAKTKIGTIGIVNCWEVADPLIARNLVEQGADILCSPSYWSNGDLPAPAKRVNAMFDIDFVNHALPAMAFEFNALVVYANVCGDAAIQLKSKAWKSYGTGQSQICAPLLGRIGLLADSNKEGFVFYSYDKNIAKVAESITDLRKDIQFGSS